MKKQRGKIADFDRNKIIARKNRNTSMFLVISYYIFCPPFLFIMGCCIYIYICVCVYIYIYISAGSKLLSMYPNTVFLCYLFPFSNHFSIVTFFLNSFFLVAFLLLTEIAMAKMCISCNESSTAQFITYYKNK